MVGIQLFLFFCVLPLNQNNCSYLQVKKILLTIYKYNYYLIYFLIIAVECIDHGVICIFHALICTDHVVVCRIIQYAHKNS